MISATNAANDSDDDGCDNDDKFEHRRAVESEAEPEMWCREIHRNDTEWWCRMAGVPRTFSIAVGEACASVDTDNDTRPEKMQSRDAQSWHFNTAYASFTFSFSFAPRLPFLCFLLTRSTRSFGRATATADPSMG